MAASTSVLSSVRVYVSEESSTSSSTTPTASQRDGNSPSNNSAVTSLNSSVLVAEAHQAQEGMHANAAQIAIQMPQYILHIPPAAPRVAPRRSFSARCLCSIILVNVGLIASGGILGAIMGRESGETGEGIGYGAAIGALAAGVLDLIVYFACRNRRNQIHPQN